MSTADWWETEMSRTLGYCLIFTKLQKVGGGVRETLQKLKRVRDFSNKGHIAQPVR